MSSATSALSFIVQTLFDLYAFVVGLRFVMHARGVSPYNPIAQIALQLTDPLVKPLQRIVPRAWGLDMATLLLCVLVAFVGTLALMLLTPVVGNINIGLMLYLAVKKTILLMFNIFIYSMFIHALLSWFISDPSHPVFELTAKIANPIVRFVSNIIPPIAGIDLSFLFGILGLTALKIFVMGILP